MRAPASRLTGWLLWALIGVVGYSTTSAAQDTADDGARQLPEVVVTAQKVPQPLEQVPASVSTLDQSFIRSTDSTSFVDLQNYIGNVNIQLSPNSGQIGIRGFETPNTNDGFDPSVGTVVDGVYYGRPTFLTAFFFDIAHFDVLRGPQGTLFGKNTTAGLLNVDTEAPKPRYLFRWEVLMTDYGERSFRPVLQAPLGDAVSIRLSGNFDHGDHGLLFNTDLRRPERNPNQNAMRLRLRWTPSAPLVFDLSAFVSTFRQNNNLFKLVRAGPAMTALDRSYDPNIDFDINRKTNSANTPAQAVSDIRGVSLNGEYDLGTPWEAGGGKIVSITGLAQARNDRYDLDADFSPVPFIQDSLSAPSPYRQFSQEFRVEGHAHDFFGLGDGFDFVSGIYFSHSAFKEGDIFSIQDLGAAAAYLLAANADQGSFGPLPPSSVGGIAGQLPGPIDGLLTLLSPVISPVVGSRQQANTLLDQRDDSWAWYGQADQYFLPHWALLTGLRLGWERKLGFASSQSEGALIGPASGGEVQPFSKTLHRFERDVSPKVGLKWKPSDRASAYLTWTRGFKSGGFNALPLNDTNLEYDPERVSSYEIGGKVRTALFGGPLETSAAAFWESFSDLQVSTLEGTSFKILNAANARSRGVEADVRWLPPVPHTSLYASLGYSNAVYTNYQNAPAPADSGQSSQNLTGRPLAFSPKLTFAVVPGYSLPLIDGASADFAFDILYQGQRYLDVDDDPRKLQPATTIYNARVTFHDRSRLWALTLAAHNLADEVILDQIVNQPLAPGNFAAVRSDRGRFFSADLMLTFE